MTDNLWTVEYNEQETLVLEVPDAGVRALMGYGRLHIGVHN